MKEIEKALDLNKYLDERMSGLTREIFIKKIIKLGIIN
jgi:hypothetical protein